MKSGRSTQEVRAGLRVIARYKWLTPFLSICPLFAAAASSNPQNPVNPVKKTTSQVSFAREVRPIIADKCLKCHGPDNTARRAELRLDTPEGCARAFQAGSSSKSPGYQRMATRDPFKQMPPPGSGKYL